MGQKVNPVALRVGFIRDWSSKWYAPKNMFGKYVEEDYKVREQVAKNYPLGSISEAVIERTSQDVIKIRIRTSRPGAVIGRRGQDIERLREDISSFTGKEVYIDVEEVNSPAQEAQIISENIAFQLAKRVNHRRAMKRSIQMSMTQGAQGIKIRCSGRLSGSEIARSEVYKEGKIPLSTLKSDIDYGYSISKTRYGTIGVKVWLYKGVAKKGQYLVRGKEEEEKQPEE